MTELQLNPAPEAEAQALCQRVKRAVEGEVLQLARLLARKEDSQLLGRTEFEVRDHVHRLGAQGLEAVLQERKKKATTARRPPVPTARRRPGASPIGRKTW